jgi:hypothetical protein
MLKGHDITHTLRKGFIGQALMAGFKNWRSRYRIFLDRIWEPSIPFIQKINWQIYTGEVLKEDYIDISENSVCHENFGLCFNYPTLSFSHFTSEWTSESSRKSSSGRAELVRWRSGVRASHSTRSLNSSPRPPVMRINSALIDSIIHVALSSPLYDKKPSESPGDDQKLFIWKWTDCQSMHVVV